MNHSVNADMEMTPEVCKEIEDCTSILTDILSWLFDTDVQVHSTEVKTSVDEFDECIALPDDLVMGEVIRQKNISPESLFKIVAKLPRANVISLMMRKLTVGQQADLAAFLMRREGERRA